MILAEFSCFSHGFLIGTRGGHPKDESINADRGKKTVQGTGRFISVIFDYLRSSIFLIEENIFPVVLSTAVIL